MLDLDMICREMVLLTRKKVGGAALEYVPHQVGDPIGGEGLLQTCVLVPVVTAELTLGIEEYSALRLEAASDDLATSLKNGGICQTHDLALPRHVPAVRANYDGLSIRAVRDYRIALDDEVFRFDVLWKPTTRAVEQAA